MFFRFYLEKVYLYFFPLSLNLSVWPTFNYLKEKYHIHVISNKFLLKLCSIVFVNDVYIFNFFIRHVRKLSWEIAVVMIGALSVSQCGKSRFQSNHALVQIKDLKFIRKFLRLKAADFQSTQSLITRFIKFYRYCEVNIFCYLSEVSYTTFFDNRNCILL